MPEIDLSQKEHQRIMKMREQARIREQKEKEKQLIKANLSEDEYQSITNMREQMQNLRQRKQNSQQKHPSFTLPYSVQEDKKVAYAIKRDLSIVETSKENAMSLCKKGEAVIWTDDLNNMPIQYPGIEGLKKLAREIIRDEKYASASRLGKLGILFGEFADEFLNQAKESHEYRGLGGSSGTLRPASDFVFESHWMKNRLNSWAREHGWSSYYEYEEDGRR